MEATFFYIFAFLTVLSVILMIAQSNPVASAIFLIFAFFNLAGLYILLQAHFVAMIQILVYAGAIMVLFVFVIMLLNLQKHELQHDKLNLKQLIVALFVMSFGAFMVFFFAKIPTLEFVPVQSGFGTVKEVGKLLFTRYVIPFEMVAILLLVGLVGAILLGRREKS